MDRHLDWPGCINARDLGGLRTTDNGWTQWRSIIRSDNPAYLTPRGWAALTAYGVRTVIALRSFGGSDDEPVQRDVPTGITVERVLVEDLTDPEFRNLCMDTDLWATPIYFRLMLERWPEQCVRGVAAVAQAQPGGVVISCGRGCDRTGLLAFLLLGLVGVEPADIATDWEMSVARLRPRDSTYETKLSAVLRRERTSVAETVVETLDIGQRLLSAGLTSQELDLARRRLLAGT